MLAEGVLSVVTKGISVVVRTPLIVVTTALVKVVMGRVFVTVGAAEDEVDDDELEDDRLEDVEVDEVDEVDEGDEGDEVDGLVLALEDVVVDDEVDEDILLEEVLEDDCVEEPVDADDDVEDDVVEVCSDELDEELWLAVLASLVAVDDAVEDGVLEGGSDGPEGSAEAALLPVVPLAEAVAADGPEDAVAVAPVTEVGRDAPSEALAPPSTPEFNKLGNCLGRAGGCRLWGDLVSNAMILMSDDVHDNEPIC